jgi:hypothetical protein
MHVNCEVVIPETVADDEIVVRTIFSPANVKSNGKLQNNFMVPPPGPDEDDTTMVSNKLSVTRFLYAGMPFCRMHGLSHSDPEKHRNYYGVVAFDVNQLRSCLFHGEAVDVLSKPAVDNPAHANVRLPFYNVAPGQPRDPEQRKFCSQLCELVKNKVLKDPMHVDGGIRDLNDNDITDRPLIATCRFIEDE